MTLNAIAKEIEVRIEQLNERYIDIQKKITYCKLHGTDEELDKLLAKRVKISIERSKLEDMLRAAKTY